MIEQCFLLRSHHCFVRKAAYFGTIQSVETDPDLVKLMSRNVISYVKVNSELLTA